MKIKSDNVYAEILGTIIQARLTSLNNLNFDDFLTGVVQDQYGLDVSEYAIPPASAFNGPTGLAHAQKHRDNTMQNVIGHIYGWNFNIEITEFMLEK